MATDQQSNSPAPSRPSHPRPPSSPTLSRHTSPKLPGIYELDDTERELVLEEALYTDAPDELPASPSGLAPPWLSTGKWVDEHELPAATATPRAPFPVRSEGATSLIGSSSPRRRASTRSASAILMSSPSDRPKKWPYHRATLNQAISTATGTVIPIAHLPSEDSSQVLEQIWSTYALEASQADNRMVAGWNRSLEVQLIFSGIFSAILTPFIIEFYKLLENQKVAPSFFGHDGYTVRVNAMFFGSLMISLTAALLSIHCKQWIQGYGAQTMFVGTSGSFQNLVDACRTRQYRYEGLKRYHVTEIINLLPIMLYVSLVLFAVGLIDLLWHLNKGIAIFLSTICGVIAAFHTYTTVVPFFTARSPFKTPLSNFLGNLWRGAWRHKRPYKLLEEDEILDVAERGEVLDNNALIWLMSSTKSEEIYENALRAKEEYTRQKKAKSG